MSAPHPGERRPGIDHLADRLVAAGFDRAAVVPGHPATRLQDALAARGVEVVDAGNERSAVELAFGWSVAGRPGLVVIKGNGMWLAAEPIQNMAAHGCVAPVLVLVGDDVDAVASTVPTDSRPIGAAVSVAVVDVIPGADGDDAIDQAVRSSVVGRRPSILRFTDRIHADVAVTGSRRPVAEAPVAAPLAPGGPAHLPTKWSRFELATASWADEVGRSWPEPVPSGGSDGDRAVGVIAVGAVRPWVDDAVGEHRPVLGLDRVHPFPDAVVARFAATVDRVLVVEEGGAWAEDQVQLALARAGVVARVLGQRTGHLPRFGARGAAHVRTALAASGQSTVDPAAPVFVPHPPAAPTTFDAVIRALREVVDEADGVTVHTCVGSCVAAAYPPHQIASTALELGAAIAVASGAAVASGSPAVAVIGDYGLVHSAIEDHDVVHRRGWPVLTIVLDDGRSEKTGGQPSPASGAVPGVAALDLPAALARGAARDRIHVVALEQADDAQLAALLRKALGDLPQTVIVTAGDHAASDRGPVAGS